MTTNPALATLQFLAGAWDMELSEASFLPDPDASVHGPVTSSGSNRARPALRMRMGGAATPTATWIIGRDDSRPDYCVLYTDDRGISRAYEMSFSDRTWRMWRDTPEFSQRFDGEVSTGQAEIIGSWQKPVDGGRTWEHDFKVRYSRLGPPGRPWAREPPGRSWSRSSACCSRHRVAAWTARVPGRGRRCVPCGEHGPHDLSRLAWRGVAPQVAERADHLQPAAGLGH
jgi:hypothetical protein